MDGVLIFAFMVGAVSSVNPCGFALLPAFFARRLGVDAGLGAKPPAANITSGLIAGSVAALGVVLAFALAGGAVLAGVSWLGDALPWAGLTIGFILIAVAVYVLLGRHVGVRIPLPASWRLASGHRGDFLFGVGYGVASLSCTLPIFLSVIAIATTGSLAGSVLSFTAFGLGMGTVVATIAVAAAISRNGLAAALRRFLPYANRFGGLVLLLAGAYVVYYWASALFSPALSDAPAIITRGERLSGWLVSVVGSETGKTILLFLMFMFVGALGWVLFRRWRRRATMQAARAAAAEQGDFK